MSTSWRITCIGPLQASDGTQIVTAFPSLPAKLLLASLALRPGELVPRDTLCERLWPDDEPERQRARFRWTLSRLRKLLSPELFISSGNSAVGLAPGTTSDVAEFDALIRASLRPGICHDELSALQEQLEELYKGEFLTGLTGEWVEAERECRAQQLKRTTLPNELGPPKQIPGNGYFGRERERQTLRAFARSDQRLLTITGTGGLGKTRLVREELLSEAFLFVSMAALTEASGLFDLLRELLKLPASGYGPVQERVTEHLKTRGKTLLLLDNAEQIAEGLAPLLEALLAQCPTLQLVVTSRRRLKLAEEQVLKLEPLPQHVAETLFLDRAQATNPPFAKTAAGKAQVTAICKLLEGIPLALELAAARALLVSPAQMRKELETRLRFLVRLRGAEARQLSVQAALEWSYELLSPQARLVFRRSGVFRGGFTLAAARFVFGDEPPALNALQELVEHSLLKADYRADDETEWVRFTMLEVVRELAELLLKAIPAEEEDSCAYHASFFLIQANHVKEHLKAGDWAYAAEELKTERANLRRLVDQAVQKKQTDVLYELVHAVGGAWIQVGLWQEADRLLAGAERLFPLTSKELADVLTLQAVLARRRGEGAVALPKWRQCLEIHKKRQDKFRVVMTYIEIISQAIDEGNISVAQENFAILDILKDDTPLLDVNKVTIDTLSVRIDYALSLFEDAFASSISIIEKCKNLDIDDASWFGIVSHIAPPLVQNRYWELLDDVLHDAIRRSFLSKQTFTMGILLMHAGNAFIETGQILASVQSFWLAHKIHQELDSRYRKKCEQCLEEAIRSYSFFPEVEQWLCQVEGESWISIYNANSLPTFRPYNNFK
jgi:predicted ATPase